MMFNQTWLIIHWACIHDLELATIFNKWLLPYYRKTLLISLGLIPFFRGERYMISWSNSLFCISLCVFQGRNWIAWYTMTIITGNSYWHRYYLRNSQRNSFLGKTSKLVKGCFQEGTVKACPRSWQQRSAPETVARTSRTTRTETILCLGVVLQYYIIPSSVTLLHFGEYFMKSHTYAFQKLSTH